MSRLLFFGAMIVTLVQADLASANQPPVAACGDVYIALQIGQSSLTISPEQFGFGSYDPDGDPLTFTLDRTEFTCADLQGVLVTLTVSDGQASDECSAMVYVLDQEDPVIVCPAGVNLCASNATLNVTPAFADNCGTPAVQYSPPSGTTFPLGVSQVWCIATDTSGNTDDCTFEVTVNPDPVVTVDDVSVCADQPATVNAGLSGGTAPFAYSWTIPPGAVDPGNVSTFVATVAGTYSVVVTDVHGCTTTDSGSVRFTSVAAGADVTVLSGESVVLGGSPTAVGGLAPFTYAWSPSTDLDDATIANPTASPAATTTYVVTVTDALGCTVSDSTIVTVISGRYLDAVLASGPVLHWSFEEAPLDPAQDRITQLASNALLPQQGATRAPSRDGLGTAASFDGTHDNAQTQPRFYADALSIGGPTVFDHYAIEMWVKLNDSTGIQYLLEATSLASTNAPAVIHGFFTDAGVAVLEYYSAPARTGEAGPTVLNDGQWHHLVFEANVAAAFHRIYVDGLLALEAPGATAWQLSTLGVGATAYWDGFHGTTGLIDELAFYDLSDGSTTGATIAAHHDVLVFGTSTSTPPPVDLPTRSALYPSVPNPFNPSTTIRFDLPRAGRVELAIYDVAGRRVRTLVSGAREAGRHEVIWRGLDDDGRQVASGVYLYRLRAGSYEETRRMTLLK